MPHRKSSAPTGRSDTPATRFVRHDSELGFWESTTRTADPRLTGLVVGPYQGWVEKTTKPMSRREVPAGIIPIIINLGPAYAVLDPAGRTPPRFLGSFVAGLHESFALIQSTGFAVCLQVNLTPLGAHELLGVPMHTLTNQTIELEDILGIAARSLTAQLQEASNWAMRFRILDSFITDRVALARPGSPAIDWAWKRLSETSGLIDVGTLTSKIGWSHKHLISMFRHEIGLSQDRGKNCAIQSCHRNAGPKRCHPLDRDRAVLWLL